MYIFLQNIYYSMLSITCHIHVPYRYRTLRQFSVFHSYETVIQINLYFFDIYKENCKEPMSNIGLFQLLKENILGIKIDLIFFCKINIKCLFHNKIHINHPIIYQKILFKMLVLSLMIEVFSFSTSLTQFKEYPKALRMFNA